MLWFVSGVAACTHPWNCETMDVCDCIYHKCLQRPQTPPRLGWPWNCLQHVGSLSWFYALRSFFGLSFGLKVYPIRFCAKDQRCGSTFDAAIRSRPPIISSLLHKNDCMTLEHFSRSFHNTHIDAMPLWQFAFSSEFSDVGPGDWISLTDEDIATLTCLSLH